MYNLEVVTRITKELLLGKNTQETYFEHYLQVPVKKGLFCSPSIIRKDKTPTCAFYKNSKGVLKYHDFAGPNFDFVGAVMYIFNCPYYKALKIIANDFGIIADTNLVKNEAAIPYTGVVIKETNKAKIQVEIKDFSQKELDWWNSFGVSKKTLEKFKVFSVKTIFLNGHYHESYSETSPIYGYFGGFNSSGDELWRLYMPMKRKYRFLSNWGNTILQGIKQLPKNGNHCILIKSLKDVMLAYEFGFISIAPTSENVLLSEAQFLKIEGKYQRIFLLFDNDLPGIKGANKYKKKYNVTCIFIKRKYAKDLSDLYKKVSNSVFWTIIEELNSIVNLNSGTTKHFYVFNKK
jgi:5S rRNA maturation endonuclease (ribonuclease M5)